MNNPIPVSPAIALWTERTWPYVHCPLLDAVSLEFTHLRTLTISSSALPRGCSGFGHTLWTGDYKGQLVGLGWDWVHIGMTGITAIANPRNAATNLRFIGRDEYLIPPNDALPIAITLIERIKWQLEVEQAANLRNIKR